VYFGGDEIPFWFIQGKRIARPRLRFTFRFFLAGPRLVPFFAFLVCFFRTGGFIGGFLTWVFFYESSQFFWLPRFLSVWLPLFPCLQVNFRGFSWPNFPLQGFPVRVFTVRQRGDPSVPEFFHCLAFLTALGDLMVRTGRCSDSRKHRMHCHVA